MRTRYIFNAVRLNQQLFLFYHILKFGSYKLIHPFCFPVHLVNDALGNGHCRTAWRIQFLCMMDFLNLNFISRKIIHQFGHHFIDMKEKVYAYTEV
ncbi:hypothetical protein D3C87_1668980 [compost metagenome]